MSFIPLRQHLRTQRQSLSASDVASTSLKITDLCCQLAEFQIAQHIAFYVANENEIDTRYLFEKTIALGKTTYFPVLNENHLDFVKTDYHTTFVKNKFDILEPSSGEKIDPNTLDIVFVPVVGFNELCHRIGRGKGYYDQTLAHINRPAFIGLAYAFQKTELPEREPWDIAMDFVVTEEKIYSHV